ncbi:protein kinase, TKL group [Dictyostelium discoideum AX4]|uniref:Probable tyrosine-protein kinase DDB_G0290471 n=1 Tax=Dictyostelium discoideum TaxID=44689 RepID=YTYK1_DICDI|nr:protein kinase, TKL group [Dictyostelium discoideum AX4]Q54G28.1 RecName: Full=Probable tyrosine-protein kinase DDB_G0290471 [Dictyostelium discoideum]EAL62251.1 protein kinase, TKL group [Dictyostelium discoideum AX4]|eukprot:XP_635744.1 protein kinase, TKL group [Dictyostelium discoideum AX4]
MEIVINNISGLNNSFNNNNNSNNNDENEINFNLIKESIVNFKLWDINNKQIEYVCRLGSGSLCRVYKGRLNGKPVAIKVFSPIRFEEFKTEFLMMQSLRSSPFLISFYGVSIVEEPQKQCYCIITEFCSRDSLYHIMTDRLIEIGWNRFFQFSMQIILGLQSLHNRKPKPIVHRDVTSLNILVNEDWECKISNFSASRFNCLNTEYINSNNQNKSFAFCSPESSDFQDIDDDYTSLSSSITSKSDIYSFGIIMFELISRIINGEYSHPFSEFKDIKNDFQLLLSSKNGLRPSLPNICPEPLEKLYKQCVDQSPLNRPSCEEVIISLNQIRSFYLLPQTKKSWDNLVLKNKCK